MVGSEASQPPPGTSHSLGKLRSVAARWTMRRRGGADEVGGDDDVELEEEGAKMKLLTATLVYRVLLFRARKVERGTARWAREGGMCIWMGGWEAICSFWCER